LEIKSENKKLHRNIKEITVYRSVELRCVNVENAKMRRVNLKKLREMYGLTQQQVSDKANISRSYYASLENDRAECKYTPTVDVVKRLSDVLCFKWEDYYKIF